MSKGKKKVQLTNRDIMKQEKWDKNLDWIIYKWAVQAAHSYGA